MRKRRYEMLLPLKFNDGRDVPTERFYQTRVDLIGQFGSLTLEPTFVRGIWTHEGIQFEDDFSIASLGDRQSSLYFSKILFQEPARTGRG